MDDVNARTIWSDITVADDTVKPHIWLRISWIVCSHTKHAVTWERRIETVEVCHGHSEVGILCQPGNQATEPLVVWFLTNEVRNIFWFVTIQQTRNASSETVAARNLSDSLSESSHGVFLNRSAALASTVSRVR